MNEMAWSSYMFTCPLAPAKAPGYALNDGCIEPKQEILPSKKTIVNVATVHDGLLHLNLFENSHSIMLIIDPDTGEFVDAHQAASNSYWYEKLELTQMNISAINTMPKRQIFAGLEKARTKRRDHFNFRHRASKGEIKDVEVYSGPIALTGKQL